MSAEMLSSRKAQHKICFLSLKLLGGTDIVNDIEIAAFRLHKAHIYKALHRLNVQFLMSLTISITPKY